MSSLIGICQVAPRLWFGQHQYDNTWLRFIGASMVVLTAKELQPPDRLYTPCKVLRVPLTDNELSKKDVNQIQNITNLIVKYLRSDYGSVVITCNSGLNRSALIAAACLLQNNKSSLEEVYNTIRRGREGSLTNKHFSIFLRGYALKYK